MAISFGTATTASNTSAPGRTGDGAISVTLPDNWAVGQFAIMIVYNDQGDASTPTNWTEISGSPFGTGTEKMCVFIKFLVTSEPTPSTTISGSGTNISHCATIITYNGVDSNTPIEAISSSGQGTGSPMTTATIATISANAWAVAVAGRGDNEDTTSATINDSATGVNIRLNAGTNAGSDSQDSAWDLPVATPSTSCHGDGTTSASDPYVAVMLILKEAVSISISDKFKKSPDALD